MYVVTILLNVFQLALFIRVVMSWFPLSSSAARSVMDIVVRITEPVLGPIRRALPSFGGIDISPIVAILLLSILVRLI
jgi:YggT family protein